MGQDLSKELSELPLELEEPGAPLDAGRIVVKVVKATDVHKGMLEIGGSDAYVMLQLDEAEEKTEVKSGSDAKEWNETFTFDVADDDTIMVVSMWDHDRFTSDDMLGCFPVPLSNFASQEMTECNYRMILGSPDPDEAASIHLQVTYTSFERLRTIKVANLAEDTDEVALQDHFEGYKRLYIVEDDAGRAAYLEMRDDDGKAAALAKNLKTIDGSQVIVCDHDRSVREVRAADEERMEAEAEAELARIEAEMEAKLAEQEAERLALEEQLAAAEEANEEAAAELRAQQAALEERLAEEKAVEEAARAKAAAAKEKKKERAAKKKAAAAARKKKAAKKKPPSRLSQATKKTKKNLSKGFGGMKKLFT